MKNIAYCFLFIFILFNIGKINSKPAKFDIYHPLKLQIEFSNLSNNNNNDRLKLLLNEASDILSKLSFTNNTDKLDINTKVMSKCKGDLTFKFISKSDIDIIIYPILERMNKPYQIEICGNHKNKMPSIVILTINENFNLNLEKDIKNKKDQLIMKIIKILIECLGLD